MSLRYLPHKTWLFVGLLAASRCSCGSDEMTMDMDVPLPDLSMPDLSGLGDMTMRLPPTITPGAADRFLLRGTLLTPTGPIGGELLIEGTMITCVAPSCSGQAGAAGATIITTSGVIAPGMLDSHNHGLFNIFDEGDWNPGKFYGNHNQWPSDARYQQMLDAKQYLAHENTSPTVDVRCEMDKYAEVKALIAGTTSFLLAPGATVLACYQSLARTIDTAQNDLGQDLIRTSIAVPSATAATSACNAIAAGTANSYVVHIAEGIDSTALNEFATLESRGSGCLLAPQTAIVHGTALTATEFGKMATANMKLVWSPKSNLFLYNDTARIDLAIAAGVTTIALAPDWSMGGGINLLDELRTARTFSEQKWPGLLSTRRLFDMVTIDAAKVLGVSNLLGSLEVGKRADVVIIGVDPGQPYDAVLTAHPSNIELVLVDGRALYGDAALKAAGPANPGCEDLPICGVSKFLCAAENSTANKLDQTFATIVQTLNTELANYDTMVSAMGIAPFSPLAPLTKCQ
jgi:cytosine/adenosine deaminase-related metal-dependent hydrolase